MTKSTPPRLPRKALAKTTFILLVATGTFAAPQNQPALQITSPANGSTINSGQTLSVTVTSPAGQTFRQVALIGPDPIGFNTSGTSMPAQFSIPIPPDADCRIYTLTADGLTQSGQSVTSAPIQIDIERSDLPAALSTLDSSSLVLESMGEQVHSIILAHFADGSVVDVTRSTLVSFASSSTAVATVDSSGAITAQSAGSATINVTYTLGSQTLQVPIPVTVKTPRLTVSPSSLIFAAQAIGSSSQPQQLTIANATTDPVSVLSVVPNGDFSETDNCVASSPLDAGGSCVVNISFSPLLVGTRPGTVSIANSANNASIDVTLSGTGTAAPPPPTISDLSPTSGPVGTSLTITGTNFGASQGTSTVSFNGTAATPTGWGATSIDTPVPSGATTGNVVVTVGGVASNGVNFTVQGTNSGGSVSLVQHNSIDAGPSSSASLAFDANNTAGNWTAVCVRAGNSGQTITVTDSNGSAYHQAVQFNVTADSPGGDTLGIFYAENIAGGANTVTVSITTASSLRFAILEYSGIAPSSSLDKTVTAQGTSTSPTSGTATTTSNGELLLGAILSGDAAAFTAGPGYAVEESVPAVSNAKLIAEDQTQTTAGAASASATLSTSTAWGAALATFKAALPPSVTSLNPTSGAPGTSVTITGGNFGSAQGNSTVTFGGTVVTPTSWSSTSLVVPVPTGAATGNVVVTVFGMPSNGLNFTVLPGQIALIQHANTDVANSASSALTFSSSNTSGNWIGVCVRAGAQGETFTVTDSNGNTYRQAIQFSDTLDTPSGNTIAIFYAENIAGGPNAVTVSDTISGTLRFAILEYSGVATSNSLDVTVGTQGSSTSPNSGSATTTVNGDLLFGVVATADPDTFTGGAGYSVKEFIPAEPATKLLVEDWIKTTAGSVSARAFLGAADPWGALLAAFKPAHSQ